METSIHRNALLSEVIHGLTVYLSRMKMLMERNRENFGATCFFPLLTLGVIYCAYIVSSSSVCPSLLQYMSVRHALTLFLYVLYVSFLILVFLFSCFLALYSLTPYCLPITGFSFSPFLLCQLTRQIMMQHLAFSLYSQQETCLHV